MFALIGVMIVLMVIMQRRSKKKQEAQVDFRRTLAVGQRVMNLGGLVGLVTTVEGDVITIQSQGGDTSSWVRRAIRNVIPDDEWDAMIAEYPDEPEDESPDAEASGPDDVRLAADSDSTPAVTAADAVDSDEAEAPEDEPPADGPDQTKKS
jgi:preprotein translocase subunit YajC